MRWEAEEDRVDKMRDKVDKMRDKVDKMRGKVEKIDYIKYLHIIIEEIKKIIFSLNDISNNYIIKHWNSRVHKQSTELLLLNYTTMY